MPYILEITPLAWQKIAEGLAAIAAAGGPTGAMQSDVTYGVGRFIRDEVRAFLDYVGGDMTRLNRASGRLRDSLRVRRLPDGSTSVGSDLIYSRIHEVGGVIRPVRAKALVFPLLPRGTPKGRSVPPGTPWVRAQQVRIPARPYLSRILQERREAIAQEYARLFQDQLFLRIRAIAQAEAGQVFQPRAP